MACPRQSAREPPAIHHAQVCLILAGAQHRQAQLLCNLQRHEAGYTAIDRSLPHPRARREKRAQLKAAKAPFKQLARFKRPLLHALEARHGHDQPPPVLHGRAHKLVRAFRRRAGEKSIRADLHREERVAALLAIAAEGHVALGKKRVIFRIGFNEIGRQFDHVAQGRALVVAGPRPVALANWLLRRPISRARAFIASVKRASVPEMFSASTIAASLAEPTMRPVSNSPTFTTLFG